MAEWFHCELRHRESSVNMLFEDKSTKRLNCKGPLTLLSRDMRFEKLGRIHEFTFRGDQCHREYQFKDGQLTAKALERDAMNRRCSRCGGPIINPHGLALRCEWRGQDYSVNDGELQPNLEDNSNIKQAWRCSMPITSLETCQVCRVPLLVFL
jgi:hypothetical protein